MLIRVWNAFSSNNSGSYTLVGTFSEPKDAEAVSAVLSKVISEEDAWQDDHQRSVDDAEAGPLLRFVREQGLNANDDVGQLEDWPQYDDCPPAVLCLGHQVMIHVGYTVSMPAVFGEYMYRRGGRVDVEMDHSHEPLVASFQFWLAWQERQARPVAWTDASTAVWAAISSGALDDVLVENDEKALARPVVVDEYEYGLMVGLLTRDVAIAAEIMSGLAQKHGLSLRLKLREALDGEEDPFASLRDREVK